MSWSDTCNIYDVVANGMGRSRFCEDGMLDVPVPNNGRRVVG